MVLHDSELLQREWLTRTFKRIVPENSSDLESVYRPLWQMKELGLAAVKKIDHVAIAVKSIDESRSWFEQVYGARYLGQKENVEMEYIVAYFLMGESLITIKELLGHKSMAMTERYSHLTPDHKHLAVKNLEAGFKRKPKIISIEKAKS